MSKTEYIQIDLDRLSQARDSLFALDAELFAHPPLDILAVVADRQRRNLPLSLEALTVQLCLPLATTQRFVSVMVDRGLLEWREQNEEDASLILAPHLSQRTPRTRDMRLILTHIT